MLFIKKKEKEMFITKSSYTNEIKCLYLKLRFEKKIVFLWYCVFNFHLYQKTWGGVSTDGEDFNVTH